MNRFKRRHLFPLYVMLVTGTTLVLTIIEAATR